jgi:hypothetical protein
MWKTFAPGTNRTLACRLAGAARALAYGKHLESQALLCPVGGRHWRIALVLPPDSEVAPPLPESMDRPVLASSPTVPAAVYAAIPNCNLYNRDGLPASPSGFLMTTSSVDKQLRIRSFRYKIGTTKREKKRYAAP